MIRVPKSDKETEKSLFSNAGNIFTVKRTNLSSEKLDDLLFLMWNKDTDIVMEYLELNF